MRAEIVWPYVEQVLKEFLGVERIEVADDGAIPIRAGTAGVFVRLTDGDHPRLLLYSPMLHGVKKTPELLDKLNELNVLIRFAKCFWQEEQVILATELLAESLDKESIDNALGVVMAAADHFDDELKATFGGETAFPDDDTPQRETPAGVSAGEETLPAGSSSSSKETSVKKPSKNEKPADSGGPETPPASTQARPEGPEAEERPAEEGYL